MNVSLLGAMRRAIAANGAALQPPRNETSGDISEKRARARRRTRLRTGKVLDLQNRFIVECSVHDRSVHGARIRLLRAVGVPQTLRLYDDERKTLTTAGVVWRRNLDLGLCYRQETEESRIRLSELDALARRYYAL